MNDSVRSKPKLKTTSSKAPTAQALLPTKEEPSAVVFTKTPMFSATNAQRYHRQALIKELEAETKRTLICFVCGLKSEVSRDDTAGFVDLLHNIAIGAQIDLLLHTPGGDIDTAEKLISLIHATVGDTGVLRVVVPDFAKSAGTLMALGARDIVMSDSSELGAIDPQVWLNDGHGNDICHSVLNYIDAYEDLAKAVRADQSDPVSKMMLEKFDPAILSKFRAIRDRARTFAENQLKRRGVNYSLIASELMNITKYPSHGQMIGWEAAEAMGLSIKYMPAKDPIWRRYWDLYCHLRLAVTDNQKIFESSFASLIF